jgi:hypothetical protein
MNIVSHEEATMSLLEIWREQRSDKVRFWQAGGTVMMGSGTVVDIHHLQSCADGLRSPKYASLTPEQQEELRRYWLMKFHGDIHGPIPEYQCCRCNIPLAAPSPPEFSLYEYDSKTKKMVMHDLCGKCAAEMSMPKPSGETVVRANNERYPNYRAENGKLYLVRCYACDAVDGKENFAGAVATGECAWCGWHE